MVATIPVHFFHLILWDVKAAEHNNSINKKYDSIKKINIRHLYLPNFSSNELSPMISFF
jgi:hypothetical protein